MNTPRTQLTGYNSMTLLSVDKLKIVYNLASQNYSIATKKKKKIFNQKHANITFLNWQKS